MPVTSLPAGLIAGSYTIRAVYNGTVNYVTSTDASHIFYVDFASTTTVAILKSDGSLWQDGPGVGPQLLSPAGTILSISSVTDGSGNVDVYAIPSDHHLWEHTPTSWLYLSAGSFKQTQRRHQLGRQRRRLCGADRQFLVGKQFVVPRRPLAAAFARRHDPLDQRRHGLRRPRRRLRRYVGQPLVGTYAHELDFPVRQFLPADQRRPQRRGPGCGLWRRDGSLSTEYNPAFAGGSLNLSPVGTILSVSAGGADEVFAITSDNHLWEHTAGWAILSTGSFASLSGATNTAGQGDLFAVLTDTSFWEYDPAFPGLWQDLVPTGASAVSAARTR